MTLPTLIDRVRSLKGADREVDACVALLADSAVSGWVRHPYWASSKHPLMREHLAGELWPSREAFLDWRDNNADVECRQALPLTASVDAVLDLIGEKLAGQQGILVHEAENDLAASGPEYTGQLARFLLLAFLNAMESRT